MPQNFSRRFCALIALACAALAGSASGQGAAGRVTLPGHRTLAAALGRRVGAVPASESIPLTLALAPRDPQGLDDLLRRLYDPHDPQYRHFLTPAQFAARFSPGPAQGAAAAAFARAQGLTVTGLTPDRLLLHLSAPSAAVEAAFGVRLTEFQDAGGRRFHAPDAEPSVPASVAPLIVGVVGLDDSAVLRPHLRPLAADPLAALDNSPLSVGTGPGGALQPSDIRTAYGLGGVGLTGGGQTLALFELDGYVPADIAAYEGAFGLPQVPLRNVLVDGGSGPLGGGQAEVTLDIELQAALAPGVSQIVVYEGPNSLQGLLDTYSRIASDNQAKQISTSWGLAESGIGASALGAEGVIFKKLAAQGQTLYAAAGDSGAYDDGSTLSVDDPASQPYVTGVGGTSLATTRQPYAYGRETTWGGGGGGVSAYWPQPYWQQGAVPAASLGSAAMRNVPDVALDADPNTGYAIYVSGGWRQYGGTSCASPLWAAFTALVNQQRAANGAPPLGFVSPALYAIGTGQFGSYARDFHDIADGSTNSNGHGGAYYPAVTGYDDATGWGSFNGAALLADLASVPPPPAPATLTATPGNAQASLSWSASPGATRYNLYRATASGGEGATPYRTGLTGTAYTDAGLTNGTTYYYTVTATDPGGESAASNEAGVTPSAPTASAATQAVYRLYYGGADDHFYTTSVAEEQGIARPGYYTLEGVIGYAPAPAAPGDAPVYRLYYPPAGEHFYTSSAAESQALAGAGWSAEGVAFGVFTAAAPGELPLYRLYSPGIGRHFYTTSQAEHDSLVGGGAWQDEGTLGYLSATASASGSPGTGSTSGLTGAGSTSGLTGAGSTSGLTGAGSTSEVPATQPARRVSARAASRRK